MSSAWARCRGSAEGVLAPLDLVDGVFVWAAGEAAIAARAVAALAAPVLDVPLVVGSGPAVPAWVGGATLVVLVDRAGESAGSALLADLLGAGGPVIGLTADARLADLLTAEGHTVVDVVAEEAVLPPLVVPLLELLALEDAAADLAAWTVPAAWTGPQGLPADLAAQAAGIDVPGFYGSDGVGAVAASWLAAQMGLFRGRIAVGASFSDALADLPTWSGAGGLRPVAWLVADDDQAGVARAFDGAAEDVRTVRCQEATPAGRLAELIGLADLVVGAFA